MFKSVVTVFVCNDRDNNYGKEYFKAFDQKPHKISSIAYDLIGLLSSLQSNNKDITIVNIANNNGFLGTNGLFRFKKDGNNRRLLLGISSPKILIFKILSIINGHLLDKAYPQIVYLQLLNLKPTKAHEVITFSF